MRAKVRILPFLYHILGKGEVERTGVVTRPVSTSSASELPGWGPPGSRGPLWGTRAAPSFLTSQERKGATT